MMPYNIWKKYKNSLQKTGLTATAALLALTLAACSAEGPGGHSAKDAFLLSKAEYPQTPAYPDEAKYTDSNTGEIKDSFYDAYDAWWTDRRARIDQALEPTAQEKDFYTKSIRQILSGSQGENRVCSPLSIYLALGMLSELTDANSRDQILSLLGSSNLETLRIRTGALWNSNYCNDGAVSSILASSLWLNQNMKYTPSTMNTLARYYYASSYQGEMGSDAFNQTLQSWLNEQTGGLLKEQAEGVKLEADTVMALATTVYFRAKWANEFSETRTTEGTFHMDTGDIRCSFMHQSDSQSYYWGSHFSAISQSFEHYGSMWLLLPDEDISAEQLLQDDEALSFLLANGAWENNKFLTVNTSVPKFDISSDLNLIEALQALGITDIFDPGISDFSPMTPDADGIFLSQARHAARVTIDEEGCTAAAYTVMSMCGAAAPPEEEVDFVLDRPFLFVITGPAGAPLFVGIVNQPVE